MHPAATSRAHPPLTQEQAGIELAKVLARMIARQHHEAEERRRQEAAE